MSDFTADLFQRVADRYDEAVPFFATFGRRLVDWAAVAPGDQVLDLGAGTGAITIAASAAVGPTGSVVAGDLAPAMVARVEGLHLPNVVARLLDARALDLPHQSFDTVLAGFVLHILELAGEADLRVVAHTEAELSLPIAGPEAHWRWLLSHGNRWLYDALGEPDRRAFKASVLTSLLDVHPAQGRRLIAGADLWRVALD